MGNYQKAQPSPFNAGVINDLCCIPLHFECALVQKQLGIFNYLHFRDTWVSFPFFVEINIQIEKRQFKILLYFPDKS